MGYAHAPVGSRARSAYARDGVLFLVGATPLLRNSAESIRCFFCPVPDRFQTCMHVLGPGDAEESGEMPVDDGMVASRFSISCRLRHVDLIAESRLGSIVGFIQCVALIQIKVDKCRGASRWKLERFSCGGVHLVSETVSVPPSFVRVW